MAWEELQLIQQGVVDLSQALAGGLTRDAVRARLDSGRWQRVHRGVFATFSGPISREATIWAAALSCGDGSAVSHATAAELAGLTDEVRAEVHVTVPATRRPAPRRGVILHYDRRLAETTHPTRLPRQTRLEHTVFDLINEARSEDEAFGWLAAACGRRLTTPSRLALALSKRPRMKWRRELCEALGDVASGCHSVLEVRYLRDVERAHGLPRGVRQSPDDRDAGRIYRDVRYPTYRTIVELDGRVAHPADGAFRDLRRDNAATALGEVTLRYGWGDVTTRPCAVATQVAAVIKLGGWVGPMRRCGAGCMIRKD